MAQGKLMMMLALMLAIGIAIGIAIRPLVITAAVPGATAAVAAAPPRARQYFDEHLDEARRIDAACGQGNVRGTECDAAGQAVASADARDRTDRFIGNRPR